MSARPRPSPAERARRAARVRTNLRAQSPSVIQLQVPIAPDLPKFCSDAIDRAEWIYLYPDRFPEITGAAFAPPGTRLRPRRPSRLRGIALTVASIAARLDRRTFRVGTPKSNGLCVGVSVAEHARATGLSLSTQARCLRDLKDAIYQESSSQAVVELERPKASGRTRKGVAQIQRYAGLPAVRRISPLLFQRLRYSPTKIKNARGHAYKQWTARHGTRATSAVAAIGLARDRRELHNGGAAPAAAPQRPLPPAGAWLTGHVRAEHPEWSDEQVAAEAAALSRPPPRRA